MKKSNAQRLLDASWTLLLGGFFLFSLFPLYGYFPSFRRAHEWALPCTPVDFVMIIISLAAVCLCCGVLCRWMPEPFARFMVAVQSGFYRAREGVVLSLLCLGFFLAAGLFSYFALDHIPHVQDSIAQLFQAKIFLTGALTAPTPEHREFFEYMNMIISNEAWYSQYLPGHALLLAAGLCLKAPWLVNPLLGGLSVALVYKIAGNCYRDLRIPYVSAALFALSPFVLFMSASFMNHTPTMFFLLVFVYCYTVMAEEHSWQAAVLAGLALGYALITRPLTACAVGLPFAVDLARMLWKRPRLPAKTGLAAGAGVCVCGLVMLLYNHLTNGSPLVFGYQVHHSALGFLGSSQFGPPHSLLRGLVNTNNNLVALNTYLFAWPLPGLVFVFIVLLPGVKKNRWDRLFALSGLSLVAAYFFYYYQDLCFGPRFFFSMVPLLAVLSARGIVAAQNLLAKISPHRQKADAAVFVILLCCILYMLCFSMPRLYRKYAADYWFVSDNICSTVRANSITNAVIFVDVSIPRTARVPNLLFYGEGFLLNEPGLDGDVICAMDLGRKNRDLMRQFPGRGCYVFTYGSVGENGFKRKPRLIPVTEQTIEQVSTGLHLDVSQNYGAHATPARGH